LIVSVLRITHVGDFDYWEDALTPPRMDAISAECEEVVPEFISLQSIAIWLGAIKPLHQRQEVETGMMPETFVSLFGSTGEVGSPLR
jgi:hypothetical protein